MLLWIDLYLPLLSLEVFEPSWSSGSLTVVIERETILMMSCGARAAGVKTAMRRVGGLKAAALALC